MLRSHLDRLESNLTSKHKLSYVVTKKSLKKNPTQFDCCEETNCMKSLFWQAFYANSILFCDDQILFKVENKCETKINSYKEHLKVFLTSSHQITCWKRQLWFRFLWHTFFLLLRLDQVSKYGWKTHLVFWLIFCSGRKIVR